MSECSTEIYRVFVIGMCTCSSILIKITAARNQNDLWNKKSLRFNQIDCSSRKQADAHINDDRLLLHGQQSVNEQKLW